MKQIGFYSLAPLNTEIKQGDRYVDQGLLHICIFLSLKCPMAVRKKAFLTLCKAGVALAAICDMGQQAPPF